MKRWLTFRRWLLAPLVYLAALFLLSEEWLWRVGAGLMAYAGRLPPLRTLAGWIARLPPYPALLLFVFPAVLLFPVKILALLAIAHGHVWSGVGVILAAKLGGAAAVARIYVLTRPALLTLDWFARRHAAFIAFKERCIARLRASAAWRQLKGWLAALAASRQAWALAWRGRHAGRRRASVRTMRVLRRFATLWRARRR
ncbi:MAG TPA: hypothetical protein VGP06_08755 [Janthinobacterium sp.]|jgi:hypothetical protein|nr:hypothetical protein [Janthinobacterium sp.]